MLCHNNMKVLTWHAQHVCVCHVLLLTPAFCGFVLCSAFIPSSGVWQNQTIDLYLVYDADVVIMIFTFYIARAALCGLW